MDTTALRYVSSNMTAVAGRETTRVEGMGKSLPIPFNRFVPGGLKRDNRGHQEPNVNLALNTRGYCETDTTISKLNIPQNYV